MVIQLVLLLVSIKMLKWSWTSLIVSHLYFVMMGSCLFERCPTFSLLYVEFNLQNAGQLFCGYKIIFLGNILKKSYIETTFGTVQKWSSRSLSDGLFERVSGIEKSVVMPLSQCNEYSRKRLWFTRVPVYIIFLILAQKHRL